MIINFKQSDPSLRSNESPLSSLRVLTTTLMKSLFNVKITNIVSIFYIKFLLLSSFRGCQNSFLMLVKKNEANFCCHIFVAQSHLKILSKKVAVGLLVSKWTLIQKFLSLFFSSMANENNLYWLLEVLVHKYIFVNNRILSWEGLQHP